MEQVIPRDLTLRNFGYVDLEPPGVLAFNSTQKRQGRRRYRSATSARSMSRGETELETPLTLAFLSLDKRRNVWCCRKELDAAKVKPVHF